MRRGIHRLDRLKRSSIHTAVAVAVMACVPAWTARAQSAPATAASIDFHITAGDLAGALDQLSTQTGIQLMYQPELVAGKRARALSGHLAWKEALDRLLQGSGLEYKQINATTVVIRGARGNAKPGPRPAAASRSKSAAGEKLSVTDVQGVTVTGTRIRGGVTASPTITIDAQEMQQQGFTDLGQVVRSVTQNYRGGQNPGVALGASAGGIANQNISGGSALNLRGLGPDATLTLLDGRRMSYDGFVQAVDISAIPMAAVQRIEIVPDGASAIYGSDAVAGVANVVLKPQFQGVTLGTDFGTTADGGLTTRGYNATAGATWSSGGLIATFRKEKQDPIYATQRDYTRGMDDPSTIYSGHELRSGLISIHQNLGERIEFGMDALKTDRDVSSEFAYPGYYYSEPFMPKVVLLAPVLKFFLPGDWTFTTSFTSGKDEDNYLSYYVTPDSSTLQSRGCYCNKSRAWEVGVEGPLFHMGTNEVRLAAGAGYRTNDFIVKSFLSGSREGGSEHNKFAYAELSVPLVSEQDARPGVHRLELSLAARAEDYDSFGRVATPKVGIIYSPTENFTLKSSWGRSFKAPTLLQQYEGRLAYLWSVDQMGGTGYAAGSTVLMSYGGNPDLKPERARTWTTSLVFHPEALPGLNAELSYFNIDYTDRVVQPLLYRANTLSDPAYAQFVMYAPTAKQQQELLAEYADSFYNYAGADYDPDKVVAIAHDEYINVGKQRVKGVDLSGSYHLGLGAGELELTGSASWIESSQKNSASAAPIDLAGTIYQPAKFGSRIGAIWHSGGFTASSYANYTQGVISRLTATPEKTASFTTFDATLQYETQPGSTALSGITISLSIQNLFNRPPPLYTPPYTAYVPFDSTNYSAIGRYTSVSVAKHF
jgi:outer membrane receptor protein involved in Fe transport